MRAPRTERNRSTARVTTARRLALVGGPPAFGRALAGRLERDGHDVLTLETGDTGVVLDAGVDELASRIADRDVVVTIGMAGESPWPWVAALDAIAAIRVAVAQPTSRLVLLSVGVRDGSSPAEPVALQWHDEAIARAAWPCPPWRVADLCRRIVPDGVDVVEARARVATFARDVLSQLVPADRFVHLVVDEIVDAAVDSSVTAMVRAAQRGDRFEIDDVRTFVTVGEIADSLGRVEPPGGPLGTALTVADVATDKGLAPAVREIVDAQCAPIACDPPLRVAPPPRPLRPDVVADRQQAAMWSGRVKYGNEWTKRLEHQLGEVLELGADRRAVLTTSGTDALRVAVAAVTPAAGPGAEAILPSFTFPATAEVLVQLGYALRFVDVDPESWTLDPRRLDEALRTASAAVVVAVDTMGNPACYDELRPICAAHGVPLVADSAAALGSRYRGRPVGTQADAHAFSMSFAKPVSAGGAGGVAVVPADAELPVRSGWPRNAMSELHAIAGCDQLDILEALMCKRSAVRDVYEALTQRSDLLSSQSVAADDRHAWGFWVMRVGGGLRARLQHELGALGIETKVYYPALHRSGWDGTAGDLSVSDALDREALALPLSSELTPATAERVADAVDAIMRMAAAR